jgi:hypothetical protein
MQKRIIAILFFCVFGHVAYAGGNEEQEERYMPVGSCEGQGFSAQVFEIQWYDHFRNVVAWICRYEVVLTSPDKLEERYVVNKQEASFIGSRLKLEKQANPGQFNLNTESHPNPISVTCNFNS